MNSSPPGDAPDEGRYGEAFFRPDRAGEAERIDFGALAYDDITMARLRALGAGPGWRCLDIGAGTGTVSRRLLGEAGVASVLAVDRDVRFLDARPTPGLRTLQTDVTAPGSFQLVHARFVLMHLPERDRLIGRFAELLTPGGVLVLSDAVDLTSERAPATLYSTAMRAMWQGLRATIGTDVSLVPSYPHLLRGAGLDHVAAEIHVPPLVPGSAISRFWADTWQRSREAMLSTSLVDDAGIDAAVRYLESDACAALSAGMLTAWGQKPQGPRG
ncbi:SAM-dependent methyltransferase [Streptomyces griseus]|uniref:class I SAM-dependent methyltransferase n=1 Tax=Streptomyces globisporus TaxID=1908 RepID=UPI0005CB196B|nr:class I SAM-dependent methyltransferase [Streptomyces globisporus]AWL84543.1 methyltransferase domain-containing protein [Streptomyces globisporus]PPA38328.1 SAM-dependent methyltransferase [Streptomyces griseus]RAN15775.1 methyltransferase [Streptomyces badius]RAN23625.1 methyltransferase [Streptomyces badius]